eukprot:Phypoly_transcript_10175.p1 GENE.Phypoly_transcript_10175~~Phypoly_transcript_10175.p1  ORF type:complete len:370 (+),score=48.84 Phypoly_transcript_10175:45-1154(+)
MPLLRELLQAGAGTPSEASSGEKYSYTMPVVAIFVIFVLGLAGSLIPPLVNVYLPKFNLNERYGFRFFNGLAAGLILAVGYIHSIPDSIESFGDAFPEDNQTAGYAWGGLAAMVGSLVTFFAEEFVHRNIGRFGAVHGHHHAHTHGKREELSESKQDLESPEEKDKNYELEQEKKRSQNLGVEHEHAHAHSHVHGNGHAHDHAYDGEIAEQELGYYTELYVLLFGLSFHSVFVGIALGVSGNDWGLFAAIIFHQFFEGLALGARVARAGFRSKLHIWFLDFVYAISAPIGIAIGIGIESAIGDDSKTYSCVNGIFQGLSAGILIYVSLIHMMKEEMERPEFKQGGPILYIMYAGFLVGAGVMAVIGIWA